jgi:hypothetical protein
MSVHARLALVAGCGLLTVGLAACGTTASTASTHGLGVVRCPNGPGGSCDDGKRLTSAPPTPKPKPKPIFHKVLVEITDDVSGGCVYNAIATTQLADQNGTVLAAGAMGKGTKSGKGCEYQNYFTHVPDTAKLYTFTTDAFPGKLSYTHTQMANYQWTFPIQLYQSN